MLTFQGLSSKFPIKINLSKVDQQKKNSQNSTQIKNQKSTVFFEMNWHWQIRFFCKKKNERKKWKNSNWGNGRVVSHSRHQAQPSGPETFTRPDEMSRAGRFRSLRRPPASHPSCPAAAARGRADASNAAASAAVCQQQQQRCQEGAPSAEAVSPKQKCFYSTCQVKFGKKKKDFSNHVCLSGKSLFNKILFLKVRSCALVVKADGLWSRGRGFEPRRRKARWMLCWLFLLQPLNDVLTTVDGSGR